MGKPASIRLFGRARSSASFRVRIALNLKEIDHELLSVDLRAGAQHDPGFLTLNPQGLVPVLLDGENILTQSIAILEYLDEKFTNPPILPVSECDKARVRALAQVIACDVHPLNNLRVLKYLEHDCGLDEIDRRRWYCHWIAQGLAALEALISDDARSGRFCHGDTPTMADICLVPQIFNARRFDCPLNGYPGLMRIFDRCMTIPAFDQAQPERQPDFP